MRFEFSLILIGPNGLNELLEMSFEFFLILIGPKLTK